MRPIISMLVLLFSICGAQTQSIQTEDQTESQSTEAFAAETTQSDISAELWELRDMVMELRTLLTVTQNELENTKAELHSMEVENYVVKERLAASETKVEVLEMVNAARETEMAEMKTRMDTVETEMLNLNMSSAAVEAELAAAKTRLAATETEALNLEKNITEQQRVAFSAALTNSGTIRSGKTPLNLVFTKVITNFGQAYNSTSGFFKAPIHGVYYFRFTVMAGADPRRYRGIRMSKNKKQIMYLADRDSSGHVYLSSGVNLQLEAGDEVNMQIPPDNLLNDSVDNHSIFSGFLLFPL